MRSRRSLALVLGAAILGACATAPAHPVEPIPVEIDQRVRVTLSSRVALGPLIGTVISVSSDTLAVAREEGGVRRLSRSQIERVEVRVERVRDPMGAAGNGILVALPWLLIGVPAVALLGEGSPDAFLLYVIVPVVGIATVGAVLGGGPQDVWVEASWPGTDAPAPTDSFGGEGR
ncbi:MAG: hypothetical protein ACREK2_09535 [Gemmatimonadota bacterium]